jgi:F-type H+-transporting ATPase subunit gamma
MAANTRDIRRRIKSVKNTAQITKAMQMVAASKMRKAQQAALAGRPYSEVLEKVLASIGGRAETARHPLLQVRPVNQELVILISTDKGLCGALNTNLLREAATFDPEKTQWIAAGRKGLQFLVRMKRNLTAEFQLKDSPTFLESKQISKFAVEQFLSGKVDRVSVLFTHFVNTLSQVPMRRVLLPITQEDLRGSGEGAPASGMGDHNDYLYEPSAAVVLESILPYFVHYEVFQHVLDARASEHSARMVAMKNATDNAKQIVKDLTLEYNKIRQASITTELLEISTAQLALG